MFIADTFDTKNTFRSSTSSINRWGEREFIHKEVRSGSQGLLIKADKSWLFPEIQISRIVVFGARST